MFSIFEERSAERYKSKVPAWNYIKDRLNGVNIPTVLNYYHSNPYPVQNQHLLVRLIQTMNLPFSMDYDEYIFRASSKTPRLCGPLGITHSVTTGKLWQPGVFYNDRCKEIIIGHSERFDTEYAVKNWKDLQPVTVLRHDYSDLSFSRQDGNYPISKDAWAVIAINVPMLMLQYRRFMETQGILPNGSRLSNGVFVGMYPVTNMLRSHLDLCIWNRWLAFCYDKDADEQRSKHPFGMPDLRTHINSIWPVLADHFYKKTMSFQEMLRFVPMVSKDSMFDRTQMPQVAPTKNITWAIAVALLPAIAYVVDVNIQFDNTTNASEINQLKLDLIRIASDNLFRRYLPRDAYLEISNYIKEHIDDRI